MELPNVKLIHPSVKPEHILQKCSIVISITSTAGLEAAFYGKPSIIFADAPYEILPSVYKIKSIMKHKHHIIPKHMGGTDDPENLIELSIEEHAEAHKLLFEKHGKKEDYWAWMGLSGMLGREELILEIAKEQGKKMGKLSYEKGIGLFGMSDEKRQESCSKGGKTAGKQNAEPGHCADIAHLGGKAASGMTFWYNSKTNEETKSFESPGEDWIPGVKIERVNIEQLRSQADNTKGTFWIHNPDTNESKMVFSEEEIPDGFILEIGRAHV